MQDYPSKRAAPHILLYETNLLFPAGLCLLTPIVNSYFVFHCQITVFFILILHRGSETCGSKVASATAGTPPTANKFLRIYHARVKEYLNSLDSIA